MENQNKSSNLIKLEPFLTSDLGRVMGIPTNTHPHSPPDDILQLQTDVINVLEKRVDINSFEIEYQKKIKSYYQFSGTSILTGHPSAIKMTKNTMDLI
jgi:hypothetical protein